MNYKKRWIQLTVVWENEVTNVLKICQPTEITCFLCIVKLQRLLATIPNLLD